MAPARGGPVDLVDPGLTGLLFDPDRPGSLRAAVASLVEGADAASRRMVMGTRGRGAVEERSWPTLTRQLVRHYSRAIAHTTSSVA